MSSRIKAMVALGLHPEQAKAVSGNVSVAQTSAGSTQGTASTLLAANVLLRTVGASEGVILPSTAEVGDHIVIGAGGASNLSVYPHSGGAINDGTANAAITVTAGNGALCVKVGPDDWVAVYS